jgi:hypothetical protein
MTAGDEYMYIFRFVLGPLFFKSGLPANKCLLETFNDVMLPKYGKAQALAYLWYGIDVTGIRGEGNNPISDLFESDTPLEIHDGEALYRSLLVDVARKLAASGTEKCKVFIQYVAGIEGKPSHKFMPKEEAQQNHNIFVPCLLKLFKEADEQCLIEPPNVTKLVEWLEKDHKKISRSVKEFTHKVPFKKNCE